MSYEQRDLSGVLFRNDKGDNDKRPDYRGDCLIDGLEYEVAGWVKSGAKGKFLSLSFKLKAHMPDKRSSGGPPPSDDLDIPFAPER